MPDISFSKYFAYIISFNPLRDPLGGPCYYHPQLSELKEELRHQGHILLSDRVRI